MAASSRAQVLDLYRAMLRESKHFSAYNYRTYAVRRIRDAFRENKNVKDPVEIQALVNKAKRDLEIIRRQTQFAGVLWNSLCCSITLNYFFLKKKKKISPELTSAANPPLFVEED
uniref:LYR motif containing 4 n=1 Tax=Equus asinus TaxID=9793 RepID=A0A9L0JN76_EQUAS